VDNLKEKWANAYKPLIFSGGAHTTSRAESTNALVKRYINKRSELSSMIELIADLDQSSAFKTCKETTNDQDEPILINIKPKLGHAS